MALNSTSAADRSPARAVDVAVVDRSGAFAKRTIDIVVGSALTVVTAPIVFVTAIALAVALRAWPFFVHERIGRSGRPFKFVKLRTLPPSTPAYASKYAVQSLTLPSVCERVRRMHLDELPQLWLVLAGKMSLVGPRPEMAFLHESMDDDFARRRTAVRPGCTGLWQISTHCQEMIIEHPEFDEHYLRHRSARFDLWILARTVRLLTPIGHRSLVSLHDLPAWARTPHAHSAAEPHLQPVDS